MAVTLAVVGATGAPARAEDDGPSVLRARARLEAARADATTATQFYVEAVGALARTEQQISGLEARIPRLEARSNELRDLLALRASDLYAGGGNSGFVAVQHALDTNDVTAGARAMRLADAAQADTDSRADEFEANQRELESDRKKLGDAREFQRQYTDAARVHTEELNAAVERANAVLREAEQQQSLQRYFAAIAAQQDAARRAAEDAARNNTPPPPPPDEQRAPADPALAGEIPVDQLPCPVTGIVTFADDWGQPRSGWRVHQGTDMFAALGTPNIAVGNGVARMRVGGLGGNAIWLVTDDGHAYYYAHLDRFEGEFAADGTRRVLAGEVIGYGGNTGNASGGPTHTHFEIHPRNLGPINPFPLLRDMCAEPSMPPLPSDGSTATLPPTTTTTVAKLTTIAGP